MREIGRDKKGDGEKEKEKAIYIEYFKVLHYYF